MDNVPDFDDTPSQPTSEDSTETVEGLPGVRVAAKPPPAKRYANSVSF